VIDRPKTRAGEGELDGHYVPARRSDVQWVDLDGEAVVYDPSAQTLHRLNRSATSVWRACDGRTSLVDIVRLLQSTHSGPDDVIARDVCEVVRSLRRTGLLREPAEDTGPES
jgi:hypothetical protein